MKLLLVISTIWIVITGCGWTPDRSNPYDPTSSNYVPPRQANRSPVIDTLIVNTECLNLPINDDCAIIIKAVIHDLDENLSLNSVLVYIEDTLIGDRPFGTMSYDAPGEFWILKRQETELDSAPETFVNSTVKVSAVDDSGAIAERTLRFPSFNLPYPRINWPHNFDCVCPTYHTFSWNRWNGQGHALGYEIRFYFANTVYVPYLTISDISIDDTTHDVIDLFADFEPSDGNDLVFYGWRVFIFDEIGNSAGSVPETFKYYAICNDSCAGP